MYKVLRGGYSLTITKTIRFEMVILLFYITKGVFIVYLFSCAILIPLSNTRRGKN